MAILVMTNQRLLVSTPTAVSDNSNNQPFLYNHQNITYYIVGWCDIRYA